MRRLLYALLGAFLSIPAAQAATFYLDCSAPTNGAGTSCAAPFNTANSLNWTTIDTNNDDVYIRNAKCRSSQLPGGAFPGSSVLNVAGTSADPVVIRSYSDPATCAPLETPTEAQAADFDGSDGTRTDIVTFFGATAWLDIKGIKCSGMGTASSGRGCIHFGATGPANFPANIKLGYSWVDGGNSTVAQTVGITVGGSDAVTFAQQNIALDNVFVRNMGRGSAVGISITNADGVSLTNFGISNISGSGNPAAIYIASSTLAHRQMADITIRSGAISGANYGILNQSFGATGSFPFGLRWNISGLTFKGVETPFYLGTIRESRIWNNYGEGAGGDLPASAASNGAIFALSSGAAIAGSMDWYGTVFERNVFKDNARFGFWGAGISNLAVRYNTFTNCGQASKIQTFGRCIELTKNAQFATQNTTMSLSATSGTGITATAGAATFASTDIGKSILGYPDNAGMCKVTAFTSSTVVTCDALLPFTSGTIAANAWTYGDVSHDIQIDGNTVSGAVGRQYGSGGGAGTEGVGIGIDDGTSRTLVRGNKIFGNEGQGISINAGHGNVITGNSLWRNGTNPDPVIGASSIRRAGILTNVGATITNNTIDCSGLPAYGVASENTTTSPPVAANGGVITATNNVFEGCRLTALLLNANDTASSNLFWDNGRNYDWMSQLTFSSAPAPANLTAQTLDGASISNADPQLGDEGRPQSTSSPVCSNGNPAQGIDAAGKRYAGRRVMGAYVCQTFSTLQ